MFFWYSSLITLICAHTRTHTCDGGGLGVLLGEDGVTKITQVFQAAVDVQVRREPVTRDGKRGTSANEWQGGKTCSQWWMKLSVRLARIHAQRLNNILLFSYLADVSRSKRAIMVPNV